MHIEKAGQIKNGDISYLSASGWVSYKNEVIYHDETVHQSAQSLVFLQHIDIFVDLLAFSDAGVSLGAAQCMEAMVSKHNRLKYIS